MMKKPNQVIDEITEVVYPPAEAILPQLYTIRTLASSTAKVYEATEDIHSILPNLDMIQRAVDYLRGAPMQDELRPTPEDTLRPIFISKAPGMSIYCSFNKEGKYDVDINAYNIEPKIEHVELFGDINFDATEVILEIPIICGRVYTVEQVNPILAHYEEKDSTVNGIDYNGKIIYVKTKDYRFDEEDILSYAFLIGKGRSQIIISITDKETSEVIEFNINSHIHFKEKETE